MRLAVALHDQLQIQLDQTVPITLPVTTWERCQTLQHQISLAHQRGWSRTSGRMRRDLKMVLNQLQVELITTDRTLSALEPEAMVQKPSDIYRDLIALREEFDNVRYERPERFLAATTEPIQLEDIYLGEFEIRLDLHNLAIGQLPSYRVIALDPHPSTPNDCVTHPHVQDESLCEGEGHHTIRHALQQGRVLDFFVIVGNLLRTYNPGSPFVSLASWNGLACSDCGTFMSDDEQWTCEKCETNICGECHYTCPHCAYSYCSDCVIRCEDCDEHYCGTCLTPCSRCQTETCRDCLDDNERCSHCHDQESEEETKQQFNTGSGDDSPASFVKVHTNRLGQAAVPA